LNFLRSPLFYVGDKFKLAPQLFPLFPEDIDIFVEPFVGGGSIAINMKAKQHFINDFNPYVANLHIWLQGQSSVENLLGSIRERLFQVGLKSSYFGDVVPQDLREAYPKTYFAKQNKQAYEQLRMEFNASDHSSMLDFYILLIFGFNRMIRFNSHGEFNVPVGNVDFNKNVVEALNGYLLWSKSADIRVSSADYFEAIQSSAITNSSFIYVDPPYLIAQTEYNKPWGADEEVRLLETLSRLDSAGIKWALSNVLTYRGAENEILAKWSQKFKVTSIRANYINYHDNGNKRPGEVLVTNYD
jgi:DNA adenine methylase